MIHREITIGRDKNCDICLDSQCVSASRVHAILLVDGNVLLYRDMSRNGTLINNIRVQNRSVPIHHGDVIMIAGQYPLSWNVIDRFIPNSSMDSGKTTFGQEFRQDTYNRGESARNDFQANIIPDLDKWSWGAFSLYPLWGFFNGCWWAILINVFFGWTIIPSIIFGLKGRDLSWTHRKWISVEDFEHTQDTWDTWGIIIFVLDILFFILIIIFWASIYSVLISSLYYY